MKILVFANTYPSLYKPNYGAFVYNLIQQFGKDNNVVIISPFNLKNLFLKKQVTYGNENCTVLRPYFISLGNKKILNIDFGKISHWFIKKAYNRALKKISKPDIVYTHFLNNAYYSLEYVKNNSVPLFVASGESSYDRYLNIEDLDPYVHQYIAVSYVNQEALLKLGVDKNKINLIPNAVNYDVFKPINGNLIRKQYNIPKEKFVVGFIGHFIERKGPNRIIQALLQLNNPNIHLICVGNGGELIDNNFTTILEPMPNFKLNEIFNLMDVFVLPTLSEGHCNVIEEAKAACIPIISSKGTSVEYQLSENIGILLNPKNITEIGDAINYLYNNREILSNMKSNLTNLRGENSIQKRAKKILDLLNKK